MDFMSPESEFITVEKLPLRKEPVKSSERLYPTFGNQVIAKQPADRQEFIFTQNQSPSKLHESQLFQSLQRRFQFKLQKEKQRYDLVHRKLCQQTQILKVENQGLKCSKKQFADKVKCLQLASSKTTDQSYLQNSPFPSEYHLNIKKRLSSLEQEHRSCISGKRQLLDIQESLEMKIALLEQENKQLQMQLRQYQLRVHSLTQAQNLNLQYRKQIQGMRKSDHEKQLYFNRQLQTLQKSIQEIQSNGQIMLQNQNQSAQTKVKQAKNFSQIYSELLQERNNGLSISSLINKVHLHSKQKNGPNSLSENQLKLQQRTKDKQNIQRVYRKDIQFPKQTGNNQKVQSFKLDNNIKKTVLNTTRPFYEGNSPYDCLPLSTSQRQRLNSTDNSSFVNHRFRYI